LGDFANERPHLIWAFPGPLEQALDSVTWIETTRELRALGWRVTLVSADEVATMREVALQGLPVGNTYFLRQLRYHLGLVRYLRSSRASTDVIFFHSISAPWILPLKGMLRSKGAKTPLFVMDTRDIHPVGGIWKDRLRRMFLQLAHRFANRWADGQTAITEQMATLVRIPADRLWGNWPSGVLSEPFARAANARRWPKNDEPIQLVYLGRLLEERHLDNLCEAVVSANHAGKHFHLTLVGEGRDAQHLQILAAKSDGQIQVLPPEPYQHIPELLAKAHIGVTSLPSPLDLKYAASSPIKLLEYMAAGMPSLATENPCHTEVVGKGNYVFWAKNETADSIRSALETAWNQKSTLEALGQQAAKAVENWSWEAAAGKLDRALRHGLAINGVMDRREMAS
jgi:glycosyltransferase involved in cell wall biosynthesis